MSRQDQATRLRHELVDVRKVCNALGLSGRSKPQLRGLTVLCPWHSERTPSCSVTLAEDGTVRVRCFGCGATGDVFTLIAQVHGLDVKSQFGAVLEQAAKIAGTESPRPKVGDLGRPTIAPASYTALATRLLELCPLTDDPDVLAYVTRRTLLIPGAKAQLGALPPPRRQAALIAALLDVFEFETLALAGLVDRNRRPLELFAFADHRMVIPWRGLDGSVVVLQRRRIDRQHGQKYVFPLGMRPLYPFGAEQVLAQRGADRTVVFVEGAIDVLALRLLDSRDCLGLLPLGLPGLHGWRPEWARFANGRTVWIGFDADEAGARQVERVARDLHEAGAARVQRWTPDANDWAELVERGGGLKAVP